MAYYPDVKTGDTFVPSAQLENEIRHLVNGRDGFSGGAGAALRGNSLRIQVCNGTSATLAAKTAVGITVGNADVPEAGRYSAYSTLWGVMAANVAPSAIGPCVIMGVAEVNLADGVDSGYALPDATDPTQFIATATGERVLDGSHVVIGLNRYDEYNGQFKLMRDDDGNLAIVNGATPSAAACGQTDLPGVATVPKTTILASALEDGASICLNVFYDETQDAYSVTLAPEDDDAVLTQELGYVSKDDGRICGIYQTWESGKIEFGRTHFL